MPPFKQETNNQLPSFDSKQDFASHPLDSEKSPSTNLIKRVRIDKANYSSLKVESLGDVTVSDFANSLQEVTFYNHDRPKQILNQEIDEIHNLAMDYKEDEYDSVNAEMRAYDHSKDDIDNARKILEERDKLFKEIPKFSDVEQFSTLRNLLNGWTKIFIKDGVDSSKFTNLQKEIKNNFSPETILTLLQSFRQENTLKSFGELSQFIENEEVRDFLEWVYYDIDVLHAEHIPQFGVKNLENISSFKLEHQKVYYNHFTPEEKARLFDLHVLLHDIRLQIKGAVDERYKKMVSLHQSSINKDKLRLDSMSS